MKRRFLAIGMLVSFAGSLQAQMPDGLAKTDQPVDCGNEKVAIFEGTASKDGRYALGWTVRPNRKPGPVDWSSYRPDDPGDFYERHPFVGTGNDYDMDKQDYQLVDGVVDLRAKKFTPLQGNSPYYPGKNHWGLFVSWSKDRGGIRRAVVGNQARFSTYNLWLVSLKPDGPQIVELSPRADKAVEAYLHKRDPKDYQRYGTSYELGDSARDSEPSGTVFAEDTVTIRFIAEIPKSERDHDAGRLTLSLATGEVLRIEPAKTSRPAGAH